MNQKTCEYLSPGHTFRPSMKGTKYMEWVFTDFLLMFFCTQKCFPSLTMGMHSSRVWSWRRCECVTQTTVTHHPVCNRDYSLYPLTADAQPTPLFTPAEMIQLCTLYRTICGPYVGDHRTDNRRDGKKKKKEKRIKEKSLFIDLVGTEMSPQSLHCRKHTVCLRLLQLNLF